jgi:hypothetical protein
MQIGSSVMPRWCVCAALLLAASVPATAQQGVAVKLRDGRTLTGTFAEKGFDESQGVYVLIIDGREERIPESRVASISPTDLPPPPRPVPPAARVSDLQRDLEQILAQRKKGRYGEAADAAKKLLERLKAESRAAQNLLASTLAEDLQAYLAAQKAGEAVASYQLAVQIMNEAQREALFNLLMARLETYVSEKPLQAFTQELAMTLAMELASSERATDPQRQRALSQLESLAGGLEAAGAYPDAERLLRQTAVLFPARAGAVAAARLRVGLAHARALLESKQYEDACGQLARLVQEFSANAEARALLETAMLQGLFARIQNRSFEESIRDLRAYVAGTPAPPGLEEVRRRERLLVQERVSSAGMDEAIALLTEYLGQPLPEEHRRWAASELERLQASRPPPPPPPPQQSAVPADQIGPDGLASYYPTIPGAEYVYRKLDRSTVVVRVAAVEDDPTVNVRYVRWERHQPDSPIGRTLFYETRIADHEVYRMDEGVKETIIKFPLKKGTSWSWASGRTGKTFLYTSTVLSTRASVRVEAGVYKDCIEIEFTSKLEAGPGETIVKKSTHIYAPGVGLIKQAFNDPTSADGLQLELVKYTVPEGATAPPPPPVVQPPPPTPQRRDPPPDPKARVREDDDP